MQGQQRPNYAPRLNKDIAELFNQNFECSSSSLTVKQTSDSWAVPGCIVLHIKIYEGPYRGGMFSFGLTIPESYPFKIVNVWSSHPIWHPNINLRSGEVALPLEWSPVITLRSIALAVQMLMLEPSADNPLNIEACSHYLRGPEVFELYVQKSLHGGTNVVEGVTFPCVLTSHFDRVANGRRPESSGESKKRSYSDDQNMVANTQLPFVYGSSGGGGVKQQWSGPVVSPRKRSYHDSLGEMTEDDEGRDEMMIGATPPQDCFVSIGGHRSLTHSPINSEILLRMSLSSVDNGSTYDSAKRRKG